MDTAQDIAVIVDLDRHLMMSMHVSSVCRAAYTASCASYVRSCDRCRLMRPRQVYSPCIQFISTSCWYCNLSSIRISDILLRCLQAVQNAAARLVTGTRSRCDHITQVLQQLHWLPVRQWNLSSLSCAQQSGATRSVR